MGTILSKLLLLLLDSTSMGPLVHDVPLRWPRVSTWVVVRCYIRLLHHARDNPTTNQVPGGCAVKSAQALQALPAGAPMLPFFPRPSMKTYHKLQETMGVDATH